MSAYLPETDSEDELPPGWEERSTVRGEVYYANHINLTTQWVHPRTGKKKQLSSSFPFGWEMKILDGNKVVYVDHVNKKTSYTDPRLAFATEMKENSTDFRQKFDGSSNALQVLHGIDLTGRIAIITGSNSGIGYETARSLAFHGATVIFACRSKERASIAMRKIIKERSTARCEFIKLDLSSLANVKSFEEEFRKRYSKLDLLICNAGIFGKSYHKTIDGFELQFQVNYLSHFYLVTLLKDALKQSNASSRVLMISSESHRYSLLSKDGITEEAVLPNRENFVSIYSYNNSKLFMAMIAFELNRRWSHEGIFVNSVHPGNMVSSNLPRTWLPYRILFAIVRPFTKSLQQAASTIVYCATSRDLEGLGGEYFNNCCRCLASEMVYNAEVTKKLFELSQNFIAKRTNLLQL